MLRAYAAPFAPLRVTGYLAGFCRSCRIVQLSFCLCLPSVAGSSSPSCLMRGGDCFPGSFCLSFCRRCGDVLLHYLDFSTWDCIISPRFSVTQPFLHRTNRDCCCGIVSKYACVWLSNAVPVILATSFASALPYCELRLLEKWGKDSDVQQEQTERRVGLYPTSSSCTFAAL